MYHGSPRQRAALQPGSMCTTDPVWAAGYTTTVDPVTSRETFTGVIHEVHLSPENDYLIPGSLHEAEAFLIAYARKHGLSGGGLAAEARRVHEKSGWDALVASFRGEVVGAITLVEVPVAKVLDPTTVLRARLPDIPDNLKRALGAS